MSRFRLGVLSSPTLTAWWDTWVARFTHVSTWCSVTATHVFRFADWVIQELTTWANHLDLGSVGLLPKAWARTLARSFGVASDNSGVSLLSPFFDNWSYRGFDAHEMASIVCLVFTNGVHTVPSNTQRTRLLCDLLLSIDRTPLTGHLLFFPAGRNPAAEWNSLFPYLDRFIFQQLSTGLRAKKLFSSDSGLPSGLFTLWWVGTPDAQLPEASDTIHNLCFLAHRSGARVTAPTTMFEQAPATSPSFSSVWRDEVNRRRDLLAPRWCPKRRVTVSRIKWESVFQSWDRINDHLKFAPQPHVRKLHALRRTRASTTTKGTWIYALWTAENKHIYIGQTRGRLNRRSVGARGSEHIRLGSDFMRIQGEKLRVPSNVYKWISKVGPEKFVVTPLEWVAPHRADTAEQEWMTRWGISALFNQDLPSVASRKWLFLTDRKIWKAELASAGGTVLDVASDMLKKDRPPSPYDYSPELLLSLLPATAKLLPAGQHRLLYTRIASHFMIYHKSFLPYSIPVKIPLLSAPEQTTIKHRLHDVIDQHGTWPPSLKAYVKACIRIIVSRSRSVGDLLMHSSLTRMPTHVLSHPGELCPCQQWQGTPGFHFHHGHMVFRDPGLVRQFQSKLHPEVFSQNMKNATLPSWKVLKDHVNTAFEGIFPNLPATRQDTAVDMVCALQTCCQSNYMEKIRTADKRVYAPYIEKQRKLLPDFLVVSPMDKAVQVPIFACHEFWKHVHHDTFFQGGRYRELFRFSSHNDANIATAWSLIDSMSLCVLGKPSDLSRSVGLSPLSRDEQVKAFSHHRQYPSSLRLKNGISTQVDSQLKRIRSSLPSPAAWPRLLTLGFSHTLSVGDLRHSTRPPCSVDTRYTDRSDYPQQLRPTTCTLTRTHTDASHWAAPTAHKPGSTQ